MCRQRLAIARGLMRQRPVLMLFDEPSSALEPQAEDTIFAGYLSHARELNQTAGAITVIVSHRMSTVRLVDRIIHLHGGRVIEDARTTSLWRVTAATPRCSTCRRARIADVDGSPPSPRALMATRRAWSTRRPDDPGKPPTTSTPVGGWAGAGQCL